LITYGNVLNSNDNRLIWTSGFANNEREARNELYKLTAKAIEAPK
jgi:hypothetical protein